jgi:hypothetical protein
MMMDDNYFWAVVWQKLRPNALAQVVDFGQYLMLWTMVLGAHGAERVMAISNVEPEIVTIVSVMEKWAFIASFAGFFCGIVLRLYDSVASLRRSK